MVYLSSLSGLAPLGGEATPLRFFEPTERFFELVRQHCGGAPIVDVGAGRGHVTAALQARGHRAMGIDIRTSGADVLLLPADATAFTYPSGSVGLFCRPCHGHFVEPAIDQMLRCRVANVLYVSKPRNARGDLGRYRSWFTRVIGAVGATGEALYVMRTGWHT